MKILITCLMLLFGSSAFADAGMRITNGWVPERKANPNRLVGYLEIENRSGKDRILSHITSTDFQSIKLLRFEIQNGVEKLLTVSRLYIPAYVRFIFQPGGMHLRLDIPQRDLAVGDAVEVTFHFTDGATETAELPVLHALQQGG